MQPDSQPPLRIPGAFVSAGGTLGIGTLNTELQGKAEQLRRRALAVAAEGIRRMASIEIAVAGGTALPVPTFLGIQQPFGGASAFGAAHVRLHYFLIAEASPDEPFRVAGDAALELAAHAELSIGPLKRSYALVLAIRAAAGALLWIDGTDLGLRFPPFALPNFDLTAAPMLLSLEAGLVQAISSLKQLGLAAAVDVDVDVEHTNSAGADPKLVLRQRGNTPDLDWLVVTSAYANEDLASTPNIAQFSVETKDSVSATVMFSIRALQLGDIAGRAPVFGGIVTASMAPIALAPPNPPRRFSPLKWADSSDASGAILTATVSLTLDPREQYAPAQAPAVLAEIGKALAASVALPAVELQWMVLPSSTRPQGPKPAAGSISDLDTTTPAERRLVAGDAERPPLTLRMPLYPMAQARGALTLTPATLIFSDPAYDRDLAGSPASARDKLTVLSGADQRGDLRLILSSDRARVNRRGTVTLMLDIAYERRLDELAQAAAEARGAGPGGDLEAKETGAVARLEVGLLPVFGPPRELRFGQHLAVKDKKGDGELWIGLGKVYEMPLAMLVETDGSPAGLAPGDVLTIGAALCGKRDSTSGDLPATYTARLWSTQAGDLADVSVALNPAPHCRLTLTLTAEAVVEPPPALYLVMQRSEAKQTPADYRIGVPLHAQSPLPRRIDLMNPVRGFRSGPMLRHADFV
ncbi:hypothetical protein F2P45_19160 [Massilia sp. CCM 8733]|uniref:Uncharacterized protein n=1 Tax=Massilia mucilaginosa TaxID=2609282 RepID=A0ABX0NW86_9BURK|nr:hypothetical protein [Massilia mucilaginosa]NHZ91120.1 hypothetical protein [Massilia mucilaginosa]